MKLTAVIGLASCLAACSAVESTVVPQPSALDVAGRPVALAPSGPRLSNPAVVTSRGVLAYGRDLRSCRAAAGEADGTGDDPAALRRAIDSKPLGGTVSVHYRSGDLALDRDRLVKQCLSRRGYVIRD